MYDGRSKILRASLTLGAGCWLFRWRRFELSTAANTLASSTTCKHATWSSLSSPMSSQGVMLSSCTDVLCPDNWWIVYTFALSAAAKLMRYTLSNQRIRSMHPLLRQFLANRSERIFPRFPGSIPRCILFEVYSAAIRTGLTKFTDFRIKLNQ